MRNKAKAPSIAQELLKASFFSEYRGRYRFSQPMRGIRRRFQNSENINKSRRNAISKRALQRALIQGKLYPVCGSEMSNNGATLLRRHPGRTRTGDKGARFPARAVGRILQNREVSLPHRILPHAHKRPRWRAESPNGGNTVSDTNESN